MPRHAFPANYAAGRREFLNRATASGADLAEFPHPLLGPDGQALACDVAVLGHGDSVLLVNTATHGVEGHCGSGCVSLLLHRFAAAPPPPGVRVVLVHAINPYGFAWCRRVNEDNVDLNRNFIFAPALATSSSERVPIEAASEAYRELHRHLLPETWTETSITTRQTAFAAYRERHGQAAWQRGLMGGQYEFDDGVFYGGTQATWSNRTFEAVLARWVVGARRVAFLDVHTGLGPYACADLISGARPGEPSFERATSWFENGVSSPAAGTSTSAPLSGVIATAVARAANAAEVTSVTMEFGTYSLSRITDAIIADNWLHQRGRLDTDLGRRIKAELRQAFFPDEADWCELVSVRARQVFERALTGLSRSH